MPTRDDSRNYKFKGAGANSDEMLSELGTEFLFGLCAAGRKPLALALSGSFFYLKFLVFAFALLVIRVIRASTFSLVRLYSLHIYIYIQQREDSHIRTATLGQPH